MGQRDVVDFLRSKRKAGDHSFFSTREIQESVKNGNVALALSKLSMFGIVEQSMEDVFHAKKKYRLNKKYIHRE